MSEPVSPAVKLKVALVAVPLAGAGVPIVVCGAAVSIVHVNVAGDWSVLPAASVARTRNSCDAGGEARVVAW